MAKDVRGVHHDDNAIDREAALKKQFEKAQEQDNRPDKAPARDSRMVREDAPAPSPKPSPSMREAPDRYAAARKLEQERREAESQQQKAERAWEKLQGQQRESLERGQDNREVYGNPSPREGREEAGEKETPEQAWEKFQERQREIDRDLEPGRERE